jgi:hypothetical protein
LDTGHAWATTTLAIKMPTIFIMLIIVVFFLPAPAFEIVDWHNDFVSKKVQ